MGLGTLNRESRPPVDFATVSITTRYPGASPEEVEEQVTNKLEEEIRSVEGIRDTTSISKAGESSITVRIEMDTYNTTRVADDIQRAVQRVSLPPVILDDPVIVRANAREIPILEMAITGTNIHRARDRIADDLKDILEDVTGVSKVNFRGYQQRAFLIHLDRGKMENLQVGINEVINAVRARNRDTPAGYVEEGIEKQLIRIQGRVRSVEETENIVIRSNFSGLNVRIKDIAEVEDGEEDPTNIVRVNGIDATILTVTKTANSDAISTVDNLKAALGAFESRLPPTHKILIYDDEAASVKFRLDIVTSNALTGLVLVFISLLIFLPGTAGLLAGLSMPIAVFTTLGLMPFVGANFNNITMLALVIVLGMIVDNSIVISENYSRHRFDGLEPKEAALKAAHEFWLPITCTSLTTVAAFLPMLVTTGIMGQFIRWIPIIVSIALVASLLESFLLLPARLQFTIRSKPGKPFDQKSTWFDPFIKTFEKFIRSCLKWRYLVVPLVLLVVIASLFASARYNRFILFPRENVERYLARYEAERGTRLEVTAQLVEGLETKIVEALGSDMVENTINTVGRASLGNRDPRSKIADYVGMILISIPKEKAQISDTGEVLRKLRQIDKGPLKSLSFEPIAGGPPVGKPLNVVFRSRSDSQLQELVDIVLDKTAQIDGVFDVETDLFSSGEEYAIQLDYTMLARVGLDAESVGRALRAAFQGDPVSELYVDGDDFYLIVRYRDKDRGSLKALKNTKITDRQGNHIALENFASIKRIEGPFDRKHYNYNRAITLTAEVDSSIITSVTLNQKVREIVDQHIANFPRVSVTYAGEQESTQESLGSLKRAMLIAIMAIFAILVFLYSSFIRPLIILSTFFLGFVGVSLAFIVQDRPLSFFAMIGVVGLAGVVINASIVLLSFLDERLKNIAPNDWLDKVAQTTSLRLRAITVTTLTTVTGLVPTAYGLGGADSILMPMTFALTWGLISGTFLTLIWIPCLYAICNDIFYKLLKRNF
jgi:multidrug efflux pump subunit AcrB